MSLGLLLLFTATELGAEFWGRTVPLKDGAGRMSPCATDLHLVVEARTTAAKGKPVRVTMHQFRLRINGAKALIPPDSAGMVAAGMQHPDWVQRPRLEAGGGPVIVGRPNPVPRFPGDPRAPSPPRDRTGTQPEKPAEKPPGEQIQEAIWPDGEVHNERSGLLFFPWRGKVAKIKTLELIWNDGGEERIVKLR